MTDLQTRKFNVAAAEILSHLYTNHPTPINGKELFELEPHIDKIWVYLAKEEEPG